MRAHFRVMKFLTAVVLLTVASHVSGKPWIGSDLLSFARLGKDISVTVRDKAVAKKFIQTVSEILSHLKQVVLDVTGTAVKSPDDLVKPLVKTGKDLVQLVSVGVSKQALLDVRETLSKLEERLSLLLEHVQRWNGLSYIVKDVKDTWNVIRDLRHKHGAELLPKLRPIFQDVVNILKKYRATVSTHLVDFPGKVDKASAQIDEAILDFLSTLHGSARKTVTDWYISIRPTLAELLRTIIVVFGAQK